MTALIFVHGAKVSVAELTAGLPGVGGDETPEETSFEFYTVLPGKEVVVPDTPPAPKPAPVAAPEPAKVEDRSTPAPEKRDSTRFMLQAASFRRAGDADELKARLALLGLEASIQKVNIKDSGTWFRVKLGPYLSGPEMEAVKARLKDQDIQVLTTRLR